MYASYNRVRWETEVTLASEGTVATQVLQELLDFQDQMEMMEMM